MKKTLQVFVSSGTKGKADGTAAHPYPTLEAARNALRKLKRRGGLKTPVRVLVAPAVYRLSEPLVFTPEDGGTATCPVTWSGQGGRPVLSGARTITSWREGTINGLPCWQADLPEVVAGRWWFTQLFVNGHRRLRARFPKQGFHRFAGVPDEEAKRDPGGYFHGAMSSFFTPGEVHAFYNLADVEVVVPDHWYESHLRIASVDEANHTIHFATKGYSRFSRDETGRHTRFRLDHVAEACTDPGDWYLDRTTGTLSYIPMQGEDRATTLVEAPATDLLLLVQGDALDSTKRARHLRFEFLDFRHADWELPPENAGALQSDFQVPAAVRFVGAEDCALYGCRISQVAGWAVEVLRGCHRNRIVACALHDLGGGGVKIGHEGGLPHGWVDGGHGAFRGMDPVALGWGPCREDAGGLLAGRDRGEPSATTISDCSIHDGGLIFHSAIGVWVGDAARNRIVHNHIWNFSYSGISCGWTWGYAPAFTCDNRIEGNRIHSIGHGVLSDMGAIYTLGRQAGSTIRRNYISNVHSYGYGGWGIYPDEGSSWMRIEDNVVCGTKCGGFHQHYGRDNAVRRNVFVDALENQVQVSRHEMVRSLTFEGNLVQGSGNGALWQGAGWASARIDRNVYAGDPGRPALFAGKTWEQWQAEGNDGKGRFAEAMLLDAGGAAPATANPAAFKAAGINPAEVATIVAEAGPRWRDVLPLTIDAVPLEKEFRRPIVESLFWPWSAEWPDASDAKHPWNNLPAHGTVVSGMAHAISLTLENRGDAPARGRYRLRVVPANAARITGKKELSVALKPGARCALDTAVVATGKKAAFSIEAVAEGEGLVHSCLHFIALRSLTIPRLSVIPAIKDLANTLAPLPSHLVDGNGRSVKASVRLALAGDRLLLRVDADDAQPVRGANLYDGSGIEIFGALKTGAPRIQMLAVPAMGQDLAEARLVTRSGIIPAVDVELASMPTARGWMLTASVPLRLLGIVSTAESFVLDLVVNARRPDKSSLSRALFAGAIEPYGNSACYARVNISGSKLGAKPLASGEGAQASDVVSLIGPQLDDHQGYIGKIDHGSAFAFGPYQFKKGELQAVEMMLGVAQGGNKLHIRLDAPDGPVIGTLVTQETGGVEIFKPQTVNVWAYPGQYVNTGADATGEHLLWFTAEGGAAIANFQGFRVLDAAAACVIPTRAGPKDPHISWWEPVNARLNVEAAKGGVEVAFIGDSITQGWEGFGKAFWDKEIAPLNVINLGIGGDRLGHMLWRMENGNLPNSLNPKVAVIMAGTNNTGSEGVTPEAVVAGIAELVKCVRQRKPSCKVLVLGILPHRQSTDALVQKINPLLPELADDKEVFVLDFSAKLRDGNGQPVPEYYVDTAHLSAAGYQIWAKAMLPVLKKLLVV